MKEIELVIKMPEEVYNYIMRLNLCNQAEEYIKNGKPLPKGHGDLIDKKVAFMKVGAYLDGYDKGLEVLDKIRAELHATAEMHEDENYYLREEWIDEIIDKYRKEQE